MKVRTTGLVLAVVMMLGLAVVPASANSGGNDVGTFVGQAIVSKVGSCANTGVASNQSGGGIGAPLPTEYKRAVYGITAGNGAVTSIGRSTPEELAAGTPVTGSLNLCGRLTGPLDDTLLVDQTVVGASCAATKGWGGQGVATFPSENTTVYIQNLGWKATVGGTFVVTADASTGSKTKGTDGLVAVVQALSEGAVLGCVNKLLQQVNGPKSGLQTFDVVAAYAILANQGGIGNDKTKSNS